jgi:phage replication initiation protein
MTGSGGFTQTIDWLAFTLPKAEVADVTTLIGGDWFQSETGFRGYPVAQLMTQGKTGVGKLGTGAPRSPKEVHVDLSAGIVSQWDETKLKTVLPGSSRRRAMSPALMWPWMTGRPLSQSRPSGKPWRPDSS